MIYAILSLPDIPTQTRKEATTIFKIRDPEDFVPYKTYIDWWLNQKKKIGLLKAIAYSDTSIF